MTDEGFDVVKFRRLPLTFEIIKALQDASIEKLRRIKEILEESK